jgi:DNA-directed RNA polymerase specialized sigma24 family protein
MLSSIDCVAAEGRRGDRSRRGRADKSLRPLDDSLNALARIDPRKARVIELRFFGGLSVEETAGVLKISPQSVMRDWKLAKAWLHREMGAGHD